jgi:hypothetical protein
LIRTFQLKIINLFTLNLPFVHLLGRCERGPAIGILPVVTGMPVTRAAWNSARESRFLVEGGWCSSDHACGSICRGLGLNVGRATKENWEDGEVNPSVIFRCSVFKSGKPFLVF